MNFWNKNTHHTWGVILNSIQTSCPTEVSSRVSKCWLFVL